MKASPLKILPAALVALAVMAALVVVVTWTKDEGHPTARANQTDQSDQSDLSSSSERVHALPGGFLVPRPTVRVCRLSLETTAPVSASIEIPPSEPRDVDLSQGHAQVMFASQNRGLDITLNAKFHDPEKKAALRVSVTEDGKTIFDKTFWNETSISETISIPPTP